MVTSTVSSKYFEICLKVGNLPGYLNLLGNIHLDISVKIESNMV